VSRHSNGISGNGDSLAPSLSADGRFILFESSPGNLVDSDTNGSRVMFVHDRVLAQHV